MRPTLKLAAVAASVFAILACNELRAQEMTHPSSTITISPTSYITVGLGGTKQFTALWGPGSMANQADTSVAWSVGRPELNTGLGSISSTGLYNAPTAMPSNGQIQITATSTTTPGLSAITFLYLLPPGPTITAVSPNPIPAGTTTITIQGSGFVANAMVMAGGVQSGGKSITPSSLSTTIYEPASVASIAIDVVNPGSSPSNTLIIPVTTPGKSGSGGSGNNNGSGGSGGGTSNNTPAPVVTPGKATLALGATGQFSASNTTGWTAAAGTITAAGVYTAPANMPASGTDTITATGPGGSGTATVTLVSNVPPAITSFPLNPLPLGVFSTTITGTGFTSLSAVQLGTSALTVTGFTSTTLTVAGFAGAAAAGTSNVMVSNGPVTSAPYPIQVGVQNPAVSPAAARRFLEQSAFGPTPADAALVQTIGLQAWLNQQFSMPAASNYLALLNTSQSGMPTYFLTNAVTNPDQLRQRVAFALSQIFVTSLSTVIWNTDMIPYQDMLINDAFTNYRQILGDVTLSPAMGEYLNMANNARANPATGTAANENYAREVMQLFSVGVNMLNPDGSVQVDGTGTPIPTYAQSDVTELARVFTGWTYAQPSGHQPIWNAYITENGPMVPFNSMHDYGSKSLINGYNALANLTPQQDLDGALDNLANHPNTAPFISKQLIQHLVKSNPSPAYVLRVSTVFNQTGGDMKSILTAILLDPEARANDEGGNDQPTDGHLQEPALLLPAFVRAFAGQMTTANYYASTMASMGQDIYDAPSVFNYYAPGFTVAGTGGLKGPEFQIDNPNNTILRENLIATFFNQYSNPVQSYGPGTTVDLTAFLPLAATPSTLVDALDLTLTHGVMPAAMKQIVVNAITADNGGNLHRVETGIYLILTSSYYNVWH